MLETNLTVKKQTLTGNIITLETNLTEKIFHAGNKPYRL